MNSRWHRGLCRTCYTCTLFVLDRSYHSVKDVFLWCRKQKIAMPQPWQAIAQRFCSIMKVKSYIKKYAAVYEIKVYSSIIAQAILESGWGESKLAKVYHNYFGLKCGTKWQGKSVNLATW